MNSSDFRNAAAAGLPPLDLNELSIHAYARPDGSGGVRNHVLVLPASACATRVCQQIVQRVPGAVTLDNHAGCGQSGKDLAQTLRTLSGFGLNANVAAVMVVGLGCEALQIDEITTALAGSGKPVAALVIQDRGTTRTIEKGEALCRKMVGDAARLTRTPTSLRSLTVGLQCGGSDATSGLVANPVLGMVSDRLVAAGATVMFAETPECIGAETVLMERATDPAVASRIEAVVGRFEERLRATGEDFLGSQPGPGNIAGGITTIEEKSLGCVRKAGVSPISGVLEYAERPPASGLYLMDTPGLDNESVTGEVAGGCQIIVFTTGRGSALGCPIAPVVKVTANGRTFERMRDDIDVGLGEVVEGADSMESAAQRLWCELLLVAEGKLTRSEQHGFDEFAIWRIGPSY